MKTDDKNKKDKAEENDFPGYPHYSTKDDIYSREKEAADVDPEQPDTLKTTVDAKDGLNQKNFSKDKTGGDLDVPGAELDDAQENIGSEDEENNIYSKGDTQ